MWLITFHRIINHLPSKLSSDSLEIPLTTADSVKVIQLIIDLQPYLIFAIYCLNQETIVWYLNNPDMLALNDLLFVIQ